MYTVISETSLLRKHPPSLTASKVLGFLEAAKVFPSEQRSKKDLDQGETREQNKAHFR